MRTIILSIIFLVIAGCQGNIKPDQVTKFVKVTEVPGQSQQEIYQKVNEWFATTYQSSTDVIKMKNPTTGTIIGRGVADVYLGMGQSSPCYYLIKVEVKDGKVRFTTDDYIWVGDNFKIRVQNQLDTMLVNMQGISNSLIAHINSNSVSNNW
ncbi:MAG: DUF4468 domain-containing protein [Bermanella sp.]